MLKVAGKKVVPCVAAVAAMMLSAKGLQAQITETRPLAATTTVHIQAKGTERVPDTIFGSFLEPIGDSINNGVSSEILINRSLEGGLWNHVNYENLLKSNPALIESTNATGLPLPWEMLTKNGNRMELHVGDAANSWQSVELMGLPDALVGIRQRVYLPVHRVLGYKVSVYAKHVSGPTHLTFLLRERDGEKVYAQATVDATSGEWTKYSATLQLNEGDVKPLQAVDFGLSVEGNERVDVDQFSLMAEDAVDGIIDPDVLAMMKQMNVTELRFGGNFSSYYHWRDGIGPEDKRVTTENIAWGIPEYNNFGTDEVLKLSELLGATPQIDLNMGSGTPEEAVEWVKYIHAKHPGPVIYELGNELYGKWQVGYPTINEIGERTLRFSKAVRAVDPKATFIATGEGPLGNSAWNEAELKNPAGTFDLLSLHFIIGLNRPALKPATPEFMAAAAYAAPYAVGPLFTKAQKVVDAHAEHKGKVHFAVTEWLFNSKGEGERNFTDEAPSWKNAGGAVMAGSFLNTLLRHTAEVKLTDMTGIMEFAGIFKRKEQVFAMPAFYVFQMYSQIKGDTVLSTTSDSGTYTVKKGVAKLGDDGMAIPYVDVVATRSADGKTLTLMCVNRSLDKNTTVNFDLGTLRAIGKATVSAIHAASRYDKNDEANPTNVVSVTTPLDVSKGVTVELPYESVMVLRVPVK